MATILARTAASVEATSSDAPQPERTWQDAMKHAIRSSAELCRRLGLPPELVCPTADQDFPVFVPPEYLDKIRPGDASDPLLRQVLPSSDELANTGVVDPVGDIGAQLNTGLLQKYSHRVLAVTTGTCAVHCRYCFRRHYPYDSVSKGRDGLQNALNLIRRDTQIDEVILSGGDPLTLADSLLAWFVEELNGIPHIRRLRLHTRLPVVIPQRVCPSLLEWTTASRAAVYFVTHFNHVREIDGRTHTALDSLRGSGATLLNQAVLLRGVNDTAETQIQLCRELADHQVLPYYLHQLDPVQGAMHFEVPEDTGQQIMRQLRAELPGYAVPKYVREIPGQPNKTPL